MRTRRWRSRERAVAYAREAGAEAAEATVTIARRFHAEARETVVAKLEQSTAKSLHVRVFSGGRKASLTTTDFTGDGLRAAVARTIAGAACVAPDPYAGLPAEFVSDAPPAAFARPIRRGARSAEKVEEALALERTVRAYDPSIVNSSGSHYNDSVSVTAHRELGGIRRGIRGHARGTLDRARCARRGGQADRALRHRGAPSRRTRKHRCDCAQGGPARGRAFRRSQARDDAGAGDLRARRSGRHSRRSLRSDVGGERRGGQFVARRESRRAGRQRSPQRRRRRPARREDRQCAVRRRGVATRRTRVFEGGRLLTFLYDTLLRAQTRRRQHGELQRRRGRRRTTSFWSPARRPSTNWWRRRPAASSCSIRSVSRTNTHPGPIARRTRLFHQGRRTRVPDRRNSPSRVRTPIYWPASTGSPTTFVLTARWCRHRFGWRR